MTDKSAESFSTPAVDPLQHALKKVYAIHKDRIKELTEEKNEFKEGYEVLLQHKSRLLEKVRSLQNQNDLYCEEITRLRNLLDNIKPVAERTSAGCQTCEHLQKSLSAIQEAYKHSLEQKEKMIHYLEERLGELSRSCSPISKRQANLNLSSLLTPDRSLSEETAQQDASPQGNNNWEVTGVPNMKLTERATGRLEKESLSRNTEKVMKSSRPSRRMNNVDTDRSPKGMQTQNESAGLSSSLKADKCSEKSSQEASRGGNSEEKESPETVRMKKLKLEKNTGKRSRYTEDLVQETKRAKFDGTDTGNISAEACQQRSKVFVQETCELDTDQTASMSSDGSPEKVKSSRRGSVDAAAGSVSAVVPETLGMGFTSESESELESDVDTQETIRAVRTSPTSVLHSPSSSEETEREVLSTELEAPREREIQVKTRQSSLTRKTAGSSNIASLKPTSPVFSGTRSSRQGVESPFLFEDDGLGSGKSCRKSANMSGIVSDVESPLLLKAQEASNPPDIGQSPLLKEKLTGLLSDKKALDYSHTDTEVVAKSQERLKTLRTSKCRTRKSEKLKQSTLSQVFNSTPPKLPVLNVSPTKPEEQADIELAVRLSLQELDSNRPVHAAKPQLSNHSKQSDAETWENVPPVFKKPASPTLRSPPKKRSPNKSPLKMSPSKQRLDRLRLDSLNKSKQRVRRDVTDLDETLPPGSPLSETFSKNKSQSLCSVNIYNESLDPDVSLTQYCADTERASQPPKRTRKVTGDARCVGQSTESNSQSGGEASRKSIQTHSSLAQHYLLSQRRSLDDVSCDESTSKKRESSVEANSCDRKGLKMELSTEKNAILTREEFERSGVSRYSPTHSSDTDENEADVTLNPKFIKSHLFEAQMLESQSFPSSSRSVTFGSRILTRSLEEQKGVIPANAAQYTGEDENTLTPGGPDGGVRTLDDSFDRVPKRQQEADYAFVDVVRKKSERQHLKASSCQECYEYYKSKGCPEEEIERQIQDCSRHRARYLPPSTPEHFWSIGFPDTQECQERGYIGIKSPSKKKTAYRRRRKLVKRFRSRQEEEASTQEELQDV